MFVCVCVCVYIYIYIYTPYKLVVSINVPEGEGVFHFIATSFYSLLPAL